MRHRFPFFVALALGEIALSAWGGSLFPAPLHLTRRVIDPVSQSTTLVEQYCYADRVVTVSVGRTSIADYSARLLTVIDVSHGIYSITSFEDVAKSRHASQHGRGVAHRWEIRPTTPGRRLGARDADALEFADAEQQGRRIEVTFDRSVLLSRDAYEVVTGAAYPDSPSDGHDEIANAAKATLPRSGIGTAAITYAIPVERIDRYLVDGDEVELREEVTRIGAEFPPSSALEIPPGARRVEFFPLALDRLSRELDSLPTDPR